MIVKFTLDLLGKFLMHNQVVGVKQRKDDELKAPKDVLLFELQLVLNF